MADIKHTSPSKGPIAMTANPAQQALLYARAGSAVISVLTEPTWLKGSLLDMCLAWQAADALRPEQAAILCKEFIFDEPKIAEVRLHGADSPPHHRDARAGTPVCVRALARDGVPQVALPRLTNLTMHFVDPRLCIDLLSATRTPTRSRCVTTISLAKLYC